MVGAPLAMADDHIGRAGVGQHLGGNDRRYARPRLLRGNPARRGRDRSARAIGAAAASSVAGGQIASSTRARKPRHSRRRSSRSRRATPRARSFSNFRRRADAAWRSCRAFLSKKSDEARARPYQRSLASAIRRDAAGLPRARILRAAVGRDNSGERVAASRPLAISAATPTIRILELDETTRPWRSNAHSPSSSRTPPSVI